MKQPTIRERTGGGKEGAAEVENVLLLSSYSSVCCAPPDPASSV